MSLEVTGKLVSKETVTTTSKDGKKTFTSLEFGVELKETYNGKDYFNYILFFLNEKAMGKIENFNIGQLLKVVFQFRGVKYNKNGKENIFNKIEAWKIEGEAQPNQSPVNQGSDPWEAPKDAKFSDNSKNPDDLPF